MGSEKARYMGLFVSSGVLEEAGVLPLDVGAAAEEAGLCAAPPPQAANKETSISITSNQIVVFFIPDTPLNFT